MTDSNSATKYFYFCGVGGGRGAEAEVAVQTHPNCVILSAACADLTPLQIAEVCLFFSFLIPFHLFTFYFSLFLSLSLSVHPLRSSCLTLYVLYSGRVFL